MNAEVDWFFTKAKKWKEEFQLLREIVLGCHLAEELKWGHPCYTFEKRNIVLIHGFKEYCALLFFKGALLKDKKGILIQQTENVQAARQIRFRSVKDIVKVKATLKSYIYEAVAAEEAGLKVPVKKTADYSVPEEFQSRLNKNGKLRAAFDALTPGRQRGYILYFASAKRSETRVSRVEKSVPRILDGKGLDD